MILFIAPRRFQKTLLRRPWYMLINVILTKSWLQCFFIYFFFLKDCLGAYITSQFLPSVNTDYFGSQARNKAKCIPAPIPLYNKLLPSEHHNFSVTKRAELSGKQSTKGPGSGPSILLILEWPITAQIVTKIMKQIMAHIQTQNNFFFVFFLAVQYAIVPRNILPIFPFSIIPWPSVIREHFYRDIQSI